jgi:cell division protein ZapE
MSRQNADSARRFTWLVDVFYDDRVKLVVGAEAQPDELFAGGEDAGGDIRTATAEFARTASRLTEMQSADYLQAERRTESGKIQGVPA